MELTIRPLEEADCELIAAAFASQGWQKPASQYRQYLDDQDAGRRRVLLAFADDEFAGYLTLVWQSWYPPFRQAGIPEIMDLNVLKCFQRRGIARRLMDEAEALAGQRSPVIGIGVGLTAEYGAAQQMYVRRGYVPDGRGLSYNERFITRGETVVVDDDLILCLTKQTAGN